MTRRAVRILHALAFIAAAGTGFAEDIPAEPLSPPSGETTVPRSDASAPLLPLEECVADALAKNFSVKIQGYSVDSAKASVIIAQSVYDPVLGVTWQKSVVQDPTATLSTSTGIGGAAPLANDQSTTVTINQPVITGGTVSASYELDRDATNEVQSLLNPAYDGDVALTVSQPLLQGAGTDYGKAAIQIARLGKRISDLNFKSAVLTMISNVETAYYNVIFARRQYDVGQDSVKLAQELYNENVIKRNTGVLTNLDVLQAETGVATAESQLIGYKQTMENAEDSLLQAQGEREFKNPVGRVEFPPLPDTNVRFDLSYKLARDNGPSLAVIETTIEEYKLDALRAKRNNLPQLNVTGGVGYLSVAHSYSAANSQLWPGTGYNWQTGVALSFPWGLRDNKALYRQAMDNMASEQVSLDEADQTLVVNVRAAVRAVQSNAEGLAAASKAAALAQKQYELELAEFKVGLVTSYDVLQTQNQLETSRVSEIQARVSLYTALSSLTMLEGTSLDNYRIKLD